MEELKTILTKMSGDLGVEIFGNAQRFKSAFSDYSEGKFRGERELLIKIIEIGAYNTVTNADDIFITKKILAKKLHDEYFMDEKACYEILDIYASVLGKDDSEPEEGEAAEDDSVTLNTGELPMERMTSKFNSWSFDVPPFFKDIEKISDDWEQSTACFSNDAKYICFIRKDKWGDKQPPGALFSKRIESLSAYIAYNFKQLKNPIILNQKRIDINGLPIEYYQLQTNDDIYVHVAYSQTRGFFYQFTIGVPFEKRSEYQEQMDAFLYSIKLDL